MNLSGKLNGLIEITQRFSEAAIRKKESMNNFGHWDKNDDDDATVPNYTINLQGKPLPPIPHRQQPLPQFNNLQQRRDQFAFSTRQEKMKINNPTIKGQNGSEYRTFTVALMLANKFLDDNTYTNKTWSEVTNIPVSEINTMEMEFLSSLNYQLYVSEQQFFDWVRNMVSYVSIGDDHRNNDDSAPDCQMNVSQRSQYSQKQQPIIVPIQSISTGFKRSAEQAFVDGMMVSPPKRTSCYPTYQQTQRLVVQTQPQRMYTQTFAYPTPPPSTSSSQQLAYYNLPTTASSNSGS
ncbi:10545_t:CDS:2 [Acaulospora colombiana]|uniref:10545_t:CDS:1 n=1 Tax=Acaulospora colombiana TaxID=27376 RepID=A0ACA9KWV0_9GLOM|nr:10545_t:CDS:2 [Acaulospora colombiana]